MNDLPGLTIAFDNDSSVIEELYQEVKSQNRENLLPLVVDITHPPPSTGFANKEHLSLIDRGPAEMVLALALIHHLTIAYNIPLNLLAKFFRIQEIIPI